MITNRLKLLRKEKKWTQEEVSKKLGITRANYSHFETGRNEPDIETLTKIADIFDVSTDYLLGKTNIRKTSGNSKKVDLAKDDVIMSYEGKPIPEEDLEIMMRFLRGGMKDDER